MQNTKAVVLGAGLALAMGAGLALASGVVTAEGARFDWLVGQWCGSSTERRIEEVWLDEAGGALLGLSRTVNNSGTESFEFMRLVSGGKDAGLYVQPNGAAPTLFTLATQGENWATFENKANDFPKRIAYRRDGAALKASISGPDEEGNTLEIAFDYRLCDGK